MNQEINHHGRIIKTESCRPSLTLIKHGRVVVDVAERDVDSGGASEPPQLAAHVLGLDDHGVVFPGLPVHVCQGHPDHAWEREREGEEDGELKVSRIRVMCPSDGVLECQRYQWSEQEAARVIYYLKLLVSSLLSEKNISSNINSKCFCHWIMIYFTHNKPQMETLYFTLKHGSY